ncbi:MAG: hypothetical protein R2862_08540 [Thermoanaerobaculia bacterium]
MAAGRAAGGAAGAFGAGRGAAFAVRVPTSSPERVRDSISSMFSDLRGGAGVASRLLQRQARPGSAQGVRRPRQIDLALDLG